MGAGSSKIESIHIKQEQTVSKEKEKENNCSPTLVNRKSENLTDTQPQQQQSEIATLTQQLCESESQRLDLEDRVDTLLKELEYVNSQNIANQTKTCDETVHAKDQYIAKLEKEKSAMETELNKMKQRQKRKQKQFNTQMVEYKQEVNFQVMELQEEVSRLKEENKKLAAIKPDKTSIPKSAIEEKETPNLPGGEKMALILELSEQVTEQQDKITKLEKKLKEKEQVVDELRKRMKNNSQYLSALSKFKNAKDAPGSGDQNDVNRAASKSVDPTKTHLLQGKHGTSKSSHNRESAKLKKENPIDSLFTVDEESSENEEENLTKLSNLLHGFKAEKGKHRLDTESPVDTGNSAVQNENSVDIEESNGRDSGLGSAGKREEKEQQRNKLDDKPGSKWTDVSDFGDLGSGLSDSDFEQYGSSQGKASSAPPKLQNTGGLRLKKKSNSLKRHVSNKKSDRPPPPNMAFVDNSDTLGDDMFVNQLSPIYSPVQVS